MIYYHASREADSPRTRKRARCVEALLFEFVGDLLSDFAERPLSTSDDGAAEAAAGHTRTMSCRAIHGHVSSGTVTSQ